MDKIDWDSIHHELGPTETYQITLGRKGQKLYRVRSDLYLSHNRWYHFFSPLPMYALITEVYNYRTGEARRVCQRLALSSEAKRTYERDVQDVIASLETEDYREKEKKE